jgi:hypothetical protein
MTDATPDELAAITAMTDEQLLAKLNGFDPYDEEFRRRFRALREAAGSVVKNHDAWQHAIDHADYGSESGAKREFGYALAALRVVLGENE